MGTRWPRRYWSHVPGIYLSFTYAFSSNPRLPDACLPECIQDCAIGEEADEPVSHRDFMEEGLLGLHNVGVWHPEELHETRI